MLGLVCSLDEKSATRPAPKDVLHVKMRVQRTPVMIQLDQGCVYRERLIATACFLRSCDRAFCDWNKTRTLSLLRQLQAFQICYSDRSHVDLFLRLWEIVFFNMVVNSSESWRSIWKAEIQGWVSFNYISIRFMSKGLSCIFLDYAVFIQKKKGGGEPRMLMVVGWSHVKDVPEWLIVLQLIVLQFIPRGSRVSRPGSWIYCMYRKVRLVLVH